MVNRSTSFARLLPYAFGFAAAITAIHADAQESGLGLTAELGADAYYNNNFYSQARDKNQVFGSILKPGGRVVSDHGRLKLGIKADAQFGVFDSPSDKDNYIDANADANVDYAWNTLNKTSVTYGHVQGHDPFGQQRTEAAANLGNDLDVWHSDAIKASHRYGTKDAPVNVEVSFNAIKKHYDSNQAQTSQLNNSNLSGRAELFYNYSAKTAAVIEASGGKVYFSDPSAVARARNGTFKSFLLGVRWKATAQTTGDVRVGYLLRNFDGVSDRRFQAINWNASVTWTPLATSSLKLSTGRIAQDSYNNARFVDNQFARLELNQKFSERLNGGLSSGYTKSKFIDAARNDEGYTAGVNASYVLDKSFTLTSAVNYTKRETDFNPLNLNYDGTSGYLGIRYAP